MEYVVIENFIDLEDKNRLYEAKHPYPREGFTPTKKRFEALSTSDNKKGRPFIKAVESEDPEDEFPKHTGGGYYELSNGERVQGKDAAIEAENELKSGE
ncbi:hypothetical protein CWR48_15695 [Oceanobacillus arenosus]|uniref:Uncharacterized protein n=1 Tax=Oceanobacillus arenosus TaxID=1229153 RepID=A0A3D8PLR9_9BACI|nr:hypothetical protein [Oceanobacillus arenosus]RDW17043.1 hypothetical protein CWR48_15695 [Oceanobacillus arenosus]